MYKEHQPARAIEQYEKAASLLKRAVDLRPDEPVYQCELAVTYNNLGAVQSHSGALDQAAASYSTVVDLAGNLVRQSPAQKPYHCMLAIGLNDLGEVQRRLGQAPAAEQSFRHALACQEPLVKQDPQNVDLQSGLGVMYNDLGILLEESKRSAEAVKAYEQAVHQQQALASAPAITRYRQFLSKHYFNYGRVLRQTGRPADAARAALARRELWPKDPQHLFSVAEELALAARDLSTGAVDASGEITADKCGDYAVETLKQSMAAGWKPPNSNWTQSFLAVQNRPDFLELTRN